MASTPYSPPEAEPPLPFAGATGRGLRVAVIDSGVNPRHPHISQIVGGVSILSPQEIQEDSFIDMLGHGTAVTAAIQEKAPHAEYFAVKVFHAALRTTTPALIAAIEWAIAKEVHVINLSLGTLNVSYVEPFRALVDQAVERGVILVSARQTDGQDCLPGSLPGVIGVGLDWDCPRTTYRIKAADGSPVYSASGYPRSLPGLPRERNLSGISFAVANMTGFVLRARESHPPGEIRQALADSALAVRPGALSP